MKSDGSIREMVCTLQESFTVPYEKKTNKQKAESDETVAVWDIEKDAWRSFRIDSILSAFVVEAPANV